MRLWLNMNFTWLLTVFKSLVWEKCRVWLSTHLENNLFVSADLSGTSSDTGGVHKGGLCCQLTFHKKNASPPCGLLNFYCSTHDQVNAESLRVKENKCMPWYKETLFGSTWEQTARDQWRHVCALKRKRPEGTTVNTEMFVHFFSVNKTAFSGNKVKLGKQMRWKKRLKTN